MIQVKRSSQPKILAQNAVKWKADYLNAIKEYDANPTAENKKKVKSIEEKYNHKDIKLELVKMFNDKCAFCESLTTHTYYGDIEHFKPKSKYPALCFEWKNYLFSCKVCNSTYKGEKFPLADEDGPIINPIDENPDDFFKFEYDELMDSALLFPKNKRATKTINFFQLNDRATLLRSRTSLVKKINLIKESANNGNTKAKKFLAELSEKDEYFAFIKAIINPS